MPIGTLIAITPEFLRFADNAGLKINQIGIVAHIGQYSTMIDFTKFGNQIRFSVPHWMARAMADHEYNLGCCARLMDGYRQRGGWG